MWRCTGSVLPAARRLPSTRSGGVGERERQQPNFAAVPGIEGDGFPSTVHGSGQRGLRGTAFRVRYMGVGSGSSGLLVRRPGRWWAHLART